MDVGGVVTFTATAADSDGTVDKVDFYVAGALVGTAATSPYTLDYTTTQAGSLAVYAKATDNQGATADSALASLTVNGAPTVSTCRPDGLYQTQGVFVVLFCFCAKSNDNIRTYSTVRHNFLNSVVFVNIPFTSIRSIHEF